MTIADFKEIEEEFIRRITKTVWCTMATIDSKGRIRSRIVHPIWEGNVGWLLTGRNSLKAKHINNNPNVSMSYWDISHEQAHAECAGEFIEDMDEKKRIWDLFLHTPEPLGYDPALFNSNVDDPEFGLLKLTPWRVELWSVADLSTGTPAKVWQP